MRKLFYYQLQNRKYILPYLFYIANLYKLLYKIIKLLKRHRILFANPHYALLYLI
jgi:hypothetical protein